MTPSAPSHQLPSAPFSQNYLKISLKLILTPKDGAKNTYAYRLAIPMLILNKTVTFGYPFMNAKTCLSRDPTKMIVDRKGCREASANKRAFLANEKPRN